MEQSNIREPQKMERVWYDDGNLIIISDSKVFRVYQGVLTACSPIFRDMLSIPQRDATKIIDEADQRVMDALGLDCKSCAVVRLTDKPKDVEWFLSAILPARHSANLQTNKSALASILRLATKYEVNFLRKWAVECVEKLHPVATQIQGCELRGPLWSLKADPDDNTACIDGMFSLIHVAMSVGVPWVVPHPLWCLREVDLSSILYYPEWDEFPEEQKKRFLCARESAQEEEMDEFTSVLSLYDAHDTDTPERKKCVNMYRKVLQGMFERHGTRTRDHHSVWNDYASVFGCAGCKVKFDGDRRRRLMDQFANFLRRNGLPQPDEMEELRRHFFEEVTTDA